MTRPPVGGASPSAAPQRGAAGSLGEGRATWRYAAAGVLPRAVVQPENVTEVAEAIARARRLGEALIAVGMGARLDLGNPPRRYDVALCTARLGGIERHVAEDMTVTVRAGTTVENLNDELGERGQWLPVDPALGEETTVGGLIAADACGPLRQSHGKVRDFLIGVELIAGTGEVVRGGGRVVKNVAGYDLPKLVCGSLGTLGVVVSATFKTRPRPGEERLYVVACDGMEEACRAALRCEAGAGAVSSLEALSEGSCESIGAEAGSVLVIGTAGSAAEVEAEERRLAALFGAGLESCERRRAPVIAKAVRNSALPANDDALVARVAVLPAALPALLGRVEREASVREVVVDVTAHAAAGVAGCQIAAGQAEQGATLFAEWLRLAARQEGGWVAYEVVPRSLRGRLETWGMSGPAVALMRGVKRVFDPDGVLSPGRFVGGI